MIVLITFTKTFALRSQYITRVSQLATILVSCAVGINAHSNILQAQSKNSTKETIVREKLTKEPKWEAKSLKVYRDSNRTAADENSKEATYEFGVEPGDSPETFRFRITAFVVKNSGNVWIGPRKDVYVDTASGVIGLRVTAGAIMWMESMVEPASNGNITLDEAIDQFHTKLDVHKLHMADGHPGSNEWAKRHITRLEDFLKEAFFYVDRDQPQYTTHVRIVAVEVSGDDVKLDLENGNTKRKGSVWVNLESRKVTKAVEDNEQTFPKKKE